MVDRLVSPGVFTTENDLSFLPQGIAEIGGAFIGPFDRGPAFVPTIVTSQTEFEQIFGTPTATYYTPYAVEGYLTNASKATIVRVLGLTGYDSTTIKSVVLFVSGNGGKIPAAVVHPTQTGVSIGSSSIGPLTSPTNFTLLLSGSTSTTSYASLSFNVASSNFISNVLGTGATSTKEGYVYAVWAKALNFVSGASAGSGSVIVEDSAGRLNFSGSVYGVFDNGTTPWVRSQTIGNLRYNLFQVATFTDGVRANKTYKVSIAAVRPDPLGSYGTFTLLVRDYTDTDSNPSVLEQFDNLSLNPDDTNYVAQRIGDTFFTVDSTGTVHQEGNFPSKSKYIFVTMATGVETFPVTVLPHGFAALHPTLDVTNLPNPTYVTTRYSTPAGTSVPVANNRIYYGFDNTELTSTSYLLGLPSGSAALSSIYDAEFSLENVADGDITGSLTTTTNYTYRKFTVPFQGGFAGLNPARLINIGANITAGNSQGFDFTNAGSPGSLAYVQAINALSNPDEFDINLLVMPGVLYGLHPYIAQTGMDMVTNRGDAFYIMDDADLNASVTTAVSNVQSLNTNYAAVYHPWVKIEDVNLNKQLWVPPSVVLAGVYAFNDRVSAEWFAPAGLNRGGIDQALQVRQRLSHTDRDTLYDGRVNPIAVFPGQGIVAWGQKTLQVQASALDRINVRRLLIAVKKFIASSARFLVFEQNVEQTRQRFLNIVNPYLASVQERSGLFAFKVVMDDSNNTPDVIDRNILVGQLYLQPTRTAEFITLEFNILPTGATFPSGV